MLLTGPAIHLWFLPFMLVALTILRYAPHEPALLLSGIAAYLLTNAWEPAWPFAQWLSVWPAAVVAATNRYGAGAILFAALAVSPIRTGAIQTLLAIIIVMAARRIRIPSRPWTSYLGALSLGIYLAHPLAASVTGRLTGGADFTPTLALTLVITVVLRRVAPKMV